MQRRIIPSLLAAVTAMLGCRGVASSSAADLHPPTAVDDAPPLDASHGNGVAANARPPLPPPWWTAPSPVTTAPLSEAEMDAVRSCQETHDLDRPGALGAELLAAAQCYGDARAFGRELVAYQRVVDRGDDAEAVGEALRRIGSRAEQIDDRPRALRAHRAYLERYPRNGDARDVGQRGVCLAHSLGDQPTVDALLDELSALYGSRGFVAPPPAAFPQLCSGLAPIPRRPDPPR